MKTQHDDKVQHLIGPAELREYSTRFSHVYSEQNSVEIFNIRWDENQATITRPVEDKSKKSERREWLSALVDALEKGLWER